MTTLAKGSSQKIQFNLKPQHFIRNKERRLNEVTLTLYILGTFPVVSRSYTFVVPFFPVLCQHFPGTFTNYCGQLNGFEYVCKLLEVFQGFILRVFEGCHICVTKVFHSSLTCLLTTICQWIHESMHEIYPFQQFIFFFANYHSPPPNQKLVCPWCLLCPYGVHISAVAELAGGGSATKGAIPPFLDATFWGVHL